MITKYSLSTSAVHLQCLDQHQDPIPNAFASGVIIKEDNKNFLYTCWHVVTGYNPHETSFHEENTKRMFLEVTMMMPESKPNNERILKKNSFTLPLYNQNKFIWMQNEQGRDVAELNKRGLIVPKTHDMVKIEIPNIHNLSILTIEKNETFNYHPTVGKKILISGFPYGFSVLGNKRPEAVILTRNIASIFLLNRPFDILIDGYGAPGMSGGPVFIKIKGKLMLLGIYTGMIYPDHVIHKKDRITALGTVSTFMGWHHFDKISNVCL